MMMICLSCFDARAAAAAAAWVVAAVCFARERPGRRDHEPVRVLCALDIGDLQESLRLISAALDGRPRAH